MYTRGEHTQGAHGRLHQQQLHRRREPGNASSPDVRHTCIMTSSRTARCRAEYPEMPMPWPISEQDIYNMINDYIQKTYETTNMLCSDRRDKNSLYNDRHRIQIDYAVIQRDYTMKNNDNNNGQAVLTVLTVYNSLRQF